MLIKLRLPLPLLSGKLGSLLSISCGCHGLALPPLPLSTFPFPRLALQLQTLISRIA